MRWRRMRDRNCRTRICDGGKVRPVSYFRFVQDESSGGSVWPRLRQLGAWLGVALLAVLAGCTRVAPPPPFRSPTSQPFLTFLVPQGPIAAAQREHFFLVVALTMIVVLPVLVGTPLILWRYRYGGSARYTPKWSFWAPLEFLTWGVPIAVVVALAVVLWRSTEALDPFKPLAGPSDPPLRVEVVGYDWKWLFIYPQFNIASVGEFAFPAHRPLALTLTSNTVMQSFFIPALGSQIYAMPAMVTQLHLLADAPGDFRGLNTQFNGDGFYQQKFTAKAMTADGFKDWVKQVQATGIPLSEKAYRVIEQRNTLIQMRAALGAGQAENGALFFTNVSPNLFGAVVQSFMGH